MRLINTLFASALIAQPTYAEIISNSSFGFGNWSGAAYTSDQTGHFSHCAISADYVSGDTLFFSVNADSSVGIGVRSQGLNLTQGQEFPVALYIDNRNPFYGTAFATSSDVAILNIRDFNRAMRALRKGYSLRLQSPVGGSTYDLKGTYRALEAARKCTVKHINYSTTPNQVSVESFDRTVLFQVATEMISELGLESFRYFDAAETRDLFGENAVLWTAGEAGIVGGVLLVPSSEAVSLRDTDAGDIAYLTSECTGEVATTARNFSIQDFEARELRALCVQQDGQKEALLTKTLVGEYVLYTLLEFHSDAADQNKTERRRVSEGVALRAASYVEELRVTE